MIDSSDRRHPVFREVVFFDDEISKKSHAALFSVPDSCYRETGGDILAAISSAGGIAAEKIHIAAGWEAV